MSGAWQGVDFEPCPAVIGAEFGSAARYQFEARRLDVCGGHREQGVDRASSRRNTAGGIRTMGQISLSFCRLIRRLLSQFQ
jgi:hypothetical protein